MERPTVFDIAFVGHYTKDTVVYPEHSHTQDGGAYFFGASVAARMGLKVAVLTRLAREDARSFEPLLRLGVAVRPTFTRESTRLRLVYPSANLDERVIYAEGGAGPFTMSETQGIEARAFHVGASIRGEVPLAVVRALKAKCECLSLDLQGYLRVARGGVLTVEEWTEKEAVLAYVDVLKADAVEAAALAGSRDRYEAAAMLADLGPREVLITHDGGLLVLASGTFHEAPFVTNPVRGRSGRGDTCTGAYVARRLTASPAEATVWAAAVTSLKLEKEGPFDRTLDEVEDLIRREYQQASQSGSVPEFK